MNNRLVDALEDCLSKGTLSDENLERVLTRYPKQADELRGLLETAENVQRTLHADQPSPSSAQQRSRALFLEQAHNQRQPPTLLFPGRPRLAFNFTGLAVLVLVITSLVITSIASAHALPGEAFYPVKRAAEQTRLIFTTKPLTRIMLEQSYDKNRTDEVEALLERHLSPEIDFAGILLKVNDSWSVASIPVEIPEQLIPLAESMVGKYVEVHGIPQKDAKVLIERLGLRQIEFTGTVQVIQADEWVVDAILLKITPDSIIQAGITPGSPIQITATPLEDGAFQALTIKLFGEQKPTPDTLAPLIPGSEPYEDIKPSPSLPVIQPSCTIKPETKDTPSAKDPAPRPSKPAEPSPAPGATQTPQPAPKTEETPAPRPTSFRPYHPTETPTGAPAPTRTSTEEKEPTHTPTDAPSPSATPHPSATHHPSETPHPSQTPVPSETQKPGQTPTPSDGSGHPSETPRPSRTSTPSEHSSQPTSTPTPTATRPPSETPRSSRTPTPTEGAAQPTPTSKPTEKEDGHP